MKLPESNVPADVFWDLIYDAGKPQVLKYGIDFKVFNYLSEPISAEAVARKLDTIPEPTSRLLDMLAILGVINKKDGQYRNTTWAEEYLVEGKPTYMGDGYVEIVDMYGGMIGNIPQALKSGVLEMAPDQTYSDESWTSRVDMFSRSQRALWSYNTLPQVIEMPEFPSFKRMLDLGGSAGIYTVALVTRHPTLKGTVLDQPPVVEITKKIISEYGLQDRIDVIGADFSKDDIGKDYDLVWTSDTLEFFPDKDKLEEICKRVYQSMNPGGVFVSQQITVISKNRIWPPDAAWLSHIFAFGGLDCTLYETDISDAMLKAGFKSVESRYVKYNSGTNRVDIARK
jgi:cyclopropane fatty-acyl-phospholipid synthase-like methyltransferase